LNYIINKWRNSPFIEFLNLEMRIGNEESGHDTLGLGIVILIILVAFIGLKIIKHHGMDLGC
jgi:hypothetical protein